MTRSALSTIAFLAFAASNAVGAEIGPADDIEAAVAALSPGEELVLRGGTYTFNENITLSANGTAAEPIVIRAKDGEQPVLTQATNQQNVVEIRGSSHLVIRGIEFTGGSHGIRLMDSDYVTIEDCEIHETGDVAISANAGGTYEGLRIIRNHIHHTNGTGEGMYLGCNNNACRVANSLIEGNYVHHTNGSTVLQGDGIEIKEGSYGNIVRDNVIHDTKYPGILVYSTAGNGPANIIERNVIWNVGDNTVQMAADVVFRNNIVLGNVAMQSHQSGSPSNIEFVHNTVISAGNAVDVRDVTGPVLIANNAIYAQGTALRLISGDLAQVQLAGNIGEGGLSGASSGFSNGNGIASDMVNGNFSGSPPIDPFPAPGSALIGAGDGNHVVTEDFNGTPRGGAADAGAYAFREGGNSGWAISEAFKSLAAGPRPNPPENVQAE
jgi:parallel beta-helix repeat protein